MSKPEILLVNPNRMKPPVTPVAIDFLAATLRTEGYDVRFLDLAFEEDINTALEREVTGDLLFVGLSIRNIDDSFFATQDFCLPRVRPIIQKIRSLTKAPVVLGGVGYSVFPIAALEYCGADFGIRGDGEVAIVRLAHAFSKKLNPSDIPGLVLKGNGQYHANITERADLSKLDLSDRSTVDNLRYLNEGGMVGFETKRGCAATCSYCADIVAKGKSSRLRDPSQVARELKALVKKGIDHFQTCDSEFNVPHSHALKVARALIEHRLNGKIRWYAYMEPEMFDDELASLMARAGCVGINFGADHSNPLLLKVLGRRHTAKSIAESARLCRKYGIECMFDLLVGAPGETASTVRDLVQFMKAINPSCVGVSMGIRIYPGTTLARFLSPRLRAGEPGVYGLDSNNGNLLKPVYFLSPDLGENPFQLLEDFIGKDERFLTASADGGDADFNYNDNSALATAIREGERGTFWDILRRLRMRETSRRSH